MKMFKILFLTVSFAQFGFASLTFERCIVNLNDSITDTINSPTDQLGGPYFRISIDPHESKPDHNIPVYTNVLLASSQTATINAATNFPASIAILNETVNSNNSSTTAQNPNSIQVTIRTIPDGPIFIVDGVPYMGSQLFIWESGSTHSISAPDTFPSYIDTRLVLTGWSDGKEPNHTIAPTTDTIITAYYKTQYYLTMSSSEGGNAFPYSGWRDSSESVQISAGPFLGNIFNGWSGSGPGSYTGTNNPANIIMNGPISETASFSSCSYSIDPTSGNVGPTGDRISFGVYAQPGCTWGVLSAPGWVRLVGSGGGNGNGGLTFDIDPLPCGDSATRTGLIYIEGGRRAPVGTYQIIQDGWPNITIQTSPPGDSIILDGIKFMSPVSPCWVPGSVHSVGTDSIQEKSEGVRHVWTSWSNGSSLNHNFIVPTTDSVITANYETQYYLNMFTTGTTYCVVSPGSGWYPKDACFQIYAPSLCSNHGFDQYFFGGWAGTGDGSYSGPSNEATICMSGPITERADFLDCKIMHVAADTMFDSNGGVGNLFAALQKDCNWFAIADVPWIKLPYTYPPGLGNVNFEVDPNPGNDDRVGQLMLYSSGGSSPADTTVRIHQKGKQTSIMFSPPEGPPGTLVTISGTNFDPVPLNNIVYFGAVRAEVTAASNTSLTVIVPTGATYSPITLTINGLTVYSKEPFLVTFPNDGVIDNTSFASTVDFGPGRSVTIADIDGDGKSDLIMANSSGGVVSVFRNISTSGIINSGSFAPKVDFAVGSWPFGVITADIDGDGKLDIAAANQGGNSISVLRNTSTTGNISFASRIDIGTGRNPWLIAVGDINGDGKTDIVNTNYDTSTVSILKNQSTIGNISFARRQNIFVGNNPTGVALRDFNADGKPDLAVVVSSLNIVSVFKNASLPDTIQLEPKQDFSTGTNPQNIAVGDLQDDDKPDLVVPNVGGTTLSILKNTSMSSVISFERQDISVGVNPKNVQIADINGDAKPDLVFAGSDNTVSVLKNTGSGGNLSFAPRVSYATNNNPWLAAIGDLDGDGKPDIAVANGGSSNISILRNKIASVILVTIQTNLNGPPFTVDGTPYTTTQTFSWVSGSSHTISADTMYQPPSSPNYIWNNWSDGGSRTHEISPTTDTVFTATYKPYYYLTMNFGDLGGTYCGGTPQSGWYPKDTCLEINSGGCFTSYPHYFKEWIGVGEGSYSGNQNPAIICMQNNISEVAVSGWCSYSATSSPTTYSPSGGRGSIKLTTQSSTCGWQIGYLSDWIHIWQIFPSGAGSWIILIDVDPNSETISRRGMVGIQISSRSWLWVSIFQSAECLPPWAVTNTGNNHTIIIDTSSHPNISGTNISNGDFIGVFYDSSGTLACGGYQVWTGTDNISISAFGDDPTTPAKDGFAEGEEFKWKIFKCVGHTTYDAKAGYVPPGGIISHTNLYTANGISQLASLVGGFVTHTNNIRSGWSIISSYIEPLRTELDSVFKDARSCVIIAKNGAGKSYIPSIPVNTIGSWVKTEGYQIKMSCLDSLKITGLKVIPESTPINIPIGWSIISYLRDSEMSIVAALGSIVSDIIIVKDQNGNTYIPLLSINTIGSLKPGQGYQIKMSTARSLTYPANTTLIAQTEIVENKESVSKNPEHYVIKNTTDNNATLAIPARVVAGVMKEGDEIGVFDEQGILIGSGIYTGDNFSIAVWGDDKTTSEQDGITDGQKFTLRIWDKKAGTEKQVVKIAWQSGTGVYETNAISILEKLEISDPQANIPTHFEVKQNYPNPFNPTTKIYFTIPEETNVRITIYNMLGEVVVELLNRPLNAGYHEVVFNSQPYPTGVYYYKINAGNFTDIKKMVLIK